MNTFHIKPTDPLAYLMVDEVECFDREQYVYIRGQVIDYGDHQEEVVYGVGEAPEDHFEKDYVWKYVKVGDWLDEYRQHDMNKYHRHNLIKALESHDWYYDMSDDPGVWLMGKAEKAVIEYIMSKLPQDIAQRTYDQYCPWKK